MSGWSTVKSFSRGGEEIDVKVSFPLGCGAAIGGFAGKSLYSLSAEYMPHENMAGGVQAVLLFIAVLGTFFYTLKKVQIKTHSIRNPVACLLIGTALGTLSSFLGIGGGPFNMAFIFFFFSMPTKIAAQNSLFIILISQAVALSKTMLSESIPSDISWLFILGMIVCGVLGSEIGTKISRRMSDKGVTRLFEYTMILVMFICVYNAVRFFH